jgi:hypothetical protein
MKIEPFGGIEFKSNEKEWFGLVDNIAPNNKVELTISAENCNLDISNKIESIKQFTADYNFIMTCLYKLVQQQYRNSKWEKPLNEITEMYFLTAVSLKDDNKTWWLVLEPDFKVESIYNYFIRFTMVDREITWTNLT